MGLKVELVKAKKGDCLLLHYGEPNDPALSLIDGGPPGVYRDFLEPRLAELREERGADGTPLSLELVMVSHIDQDHIAGVLNLLNAVDRARGRHADEPYEIGRLWHNGFKSLTGAGDDSVKTAEAISDPLPEAAAVIASVGEGVDTSAVATRLGIPRNEKSEDGDLVLAGASRTLPGGLKLTVLGPTAERVKDLREEWAKEVGIDPDELVPAAIQETISNLSSMIVVAEYKGKRILLTGDAASEDILPGLERTGLLDDDGRAHFDVLKMPHHGSKESVVDPDLLGPVTADHYAISGNGEHGNPELETLRAIANARGDDAYDIWLTYREGDKGLGKKLETFEEEQRKAGSKATIHYPEDGEPSMTIDLT